MTRAEAWRALWHRDQAAALRLCDDIIRHRPVPDRLLIRLADTRVEEWHVGMRPTPPVNLAEGCFVEPER